MRDVSRNSGSVERVERAGDASVPHSSARPGAFCRRVIGRIEALALPSAGVTVQVVPCVHQTRHDLR